MEVHGGEEEFRQGRRQTKAAAVAVVDAKGGRGRAGIHIQINGGGGDEDDSSSDEDGREEGERCATEDVERAICIAAAADDGDKKSSILRRLRWMSGGGSGDAKVRFKEKAILRLK